MLKVTQFKNGKSPGNFIIRDAGDVVNDIKKGTFKPFIDTLNSFEYDSQEQRKYKSFNIPAIAWNGIFTYRANDKLTEHSGLVAIDFDHISPEDFPQYRTRLQSDRYTYALFTSPRRDGLKCIVRIRPDIERHRLYVRGLRDYYNSKYYDHFEDEARLCFVSYDPEAYFNPEAEQWETAGKEIATDNKKNTTKPATDESIDIFEKLIRWELNRNNHYSDGNKHKFLVSLFGACNRYGIDIDTVVQMAYDKFANYPDVQQVAYDDFVKIAKSVYTLYAPEYNTQKFTKAPKIERIEPEDVEPDKPQFPVEVFPDDIQNFISVLHKGLNYSKDFTSIAIICAVATLNGNKIKLRVKNEWVAPSIFWFAAVGEPGVNKTHPIKTILKPISRLDSESKERFDRALKELSEDDRKSQERRPKFKQIIVNDYTLEALHHIHDVNKRGLLLYRDELIGFLNDMNKYRKGSDEQFWLESFNNNSYIVNRVTKDPLMIEYTNINIIGTIQPEQLNNVLKGHSGNGLTDRFLYTTNETTIYPVGLEDVPAVWTEWWGSVVNAVYENDIFYVDKHDTKVISLDKSGLEAMIKYDSELCKMQSSDDMEYYMKNYLSKMKTYLPRFALVMSIFDSIMHGVELVVLPDHFDKAWKIVQYFIDSARFVFNDVNKAEDIESTTVKLNGKTKADKIVSLYKMGYKQADIAKKLRVSPAYVSKKLTKVNKS